MVDSAERKVMDMVEQGQISPEEGLRLIKAMNHKEKVENPQVDQEDDLSDLASSDLPNQERPAGPHIPEEEMQRLKHLKQWWLLPFGIGILIITLGAIWMYMGYSDHGFGFGFWLAWLPFLLGIFIVAVSFKTSQSVWVHVRVSQEPGEKPERISISLPLPVVLTKWFLSNFGDQIPGLNHQSDGKLSEVLKNISPENPFYVHVNEKNGEEVEVFIG